MHLHGAQFLLGGFLTQALMVRPPLLVGYLGVDLKLPCMVSANVTCLGWWQGVKFTSSASMSSNEALFIRGEVIVVECEATAVPHLVLTVPGIRLKISS